MTDKEKQELNHQLAEALDAAGLGEYAWDVARACPQGHLDPRPDGPPLGELCAECVSVAEGVCAISLEEWRALDETPGFHPEWRIGRIAKDFTDANILLAAVEAWIGQRASGRTITTEWWSNAKKWVAKITEFRYLQSPIVGIGEHPTHRTLAEAGALLAVVMAKWEVDD